MREPQELRQLPERQISALDRELAQQAARAHEVVAAAQANIAELERELAGARADLAAALQRAYWLDRLGLDLNALMGMPVARRLRRIARLGARARGSASRAPAAVPLDDRAAPGPSAASGPPVASGPSAASPPRSRIVAPLRDSPIHADIERVLCDGAEPLAAPVNGMSARPQLRLAIVVPHFDHFSGGHAIVFGIGCELERRGHSVSYWLHDPFRLRGEWSDANLRQAIVDDYAAINGPAFNGFASWTGADVVIATGWQTVYPAMAVPFCRSRVYLVNDHEPEFYGASVDAQFAALTYTLGLPCIVGGGPWLAAKVQKLYGAVVVEQFAYPVVACYRPRPIRRRDDTIVFYARPSTPRRATALGVMALEELKRRRPDVRVVMFGDRQAPETTFAYEHLGTVPGEQLAWLYSEATIGMAFSLTHSSLVPHDMLACGLPCVDLDSHSTGAEHRATGAVELAPFDPREIATTLERLLDDPELRARRAQAGQAYVAGHTWERAGEQVERGLRSVLAAREAGAGDGGTAKIARLRRRHAS